MPQNEFSNSSSNGPSDARLVLVAVEPMWIRCINWIVKLSTLCQCTCSDVVPARYHF